MAEVCGLRGAWREPQHLRLGSPRTSGSAAVILGIADREGIRLSHNMEQWVGIDYATCVRALTACPVNDHPSPQAGSRRTFRSFRSRMGSPQRLPSLHSGPALIQPVGVRFRDAGARRACARWPPSTGSRTRPSAGSWHDGMVRVTKRAREWSRGREADGLYTNNAQGVEAASSARARLCLLSR
jgi:hypothetical protein